MIDFWIDFGGQNAPKWIPRSAQDGSLGDQNGWKTIYWAILCQQQRCELEPNWTKIDIATILLGQSGFQGDQNGSKRIYSSILCQSGAQSDENWRQNGARLKQNRYRNYLLGEIWCPRRPNWIKNDIRMISNPITCSEMFFHDFKDQTRREKWPNVYIYIYVCSDKDSFKKCPSACVLWCDIRCSMWRGWWRREDTLNNPPRQGRTWSSC